MGFFDDSKISSPADIVEIPILHKSGSKWSNNVTGIRVGTDLADAWSIEPHSGFVDSGTSCLYLDKTTYKFLMKQLEKTTDNGFYGPSGAGQYTLANCNDRGSMPTFSLRFGDHWFEVLAQDYIYVANGLCHVCMFPQNDNSETWILGNAFMRGYYMAHDVERLTLGITP